MKRRNKLIAFLLCTVAVFLISGCGAKPTQYQTNDSEGFTVSVKFDANGGEFTTSVYSIVDSFNLSELPTNVNGDAQLSLITPDDPIRSDKFKPYKNGCFLTGWYKTRTESTDGQGNAVYTYSDKWDFQNDVLTLKTDAEYSSSTPVMTLYAAWAPLFEIHTYDRATNRLISSNSYDPTSAESIKMPQWDEETGKLSMNSFPKNQGYTFEKAYYDAQGTSPITTDTVVHPGTIDDATGTVKNHILNIYVDWREGNWFRISNAKQFVSNATLNGCYEITADLDFTDVIWPTMLMHGNFSGKIIGNGYSFNNVQLTQTDNSKINSGLFGNVTNAAELKDITFNNVVFTIKSGARVAGASFGILAGNVSDSALISNLKLQNSTLQIHSDLNKMMSNFSVGLVCGMGNYSAVTSEGLSCAVVGDNPEKITATADGNTVTLEFAQ